MLWSRNTTMVTMLILPLLFIVRADAFLYPTFVLHKPFHKKSKQIVRSINELNIWKRNAVTLMAMNGGATETESAHLQLQNIKLSPSSNEDDEADNILKKGIKENTSSKNDAKYDLVVYEVYNTSSEQVVAACFTGHHNLNIFYRHLFGNESPTPVFFENSTIVLSNMITSQSALIGRKVGYHFNDTDTYQKYHQLWLQGQFLSQRRNFAEDWKSYDPDKKLLSNQEQQIDRRPRVESIILSNMQRMQELTRDEERLEKLYQFLEHYTTTENATIWGRPLSSYHYQPPPQRSIEDSLSLLKDFSLWFRAIFPYYYSQCFHCGYKGPSSSSSTSERNNVYLGSVYSNATERQGLASRTELYHCGRCADVSRFARYNDVLQMVTARHGRCGEYSVLMMQLLRSLGYEQTRWIIDRDDHLWCEVGFPKVDTENSSSKSSVISTNSNNNSMQWYHIDPCEAAVNEPYIYESWGKRPTYIFALSQSNIEDVTAQYTRNVTQMMAIRKEENVTESHLQLLLQQARTYAEDYAKNLTQSRQLK